MRSILYFTLLFVVFGSLSLFAVEQLEEVDPDGSVRVGKDLNSQQNTTQQGNELESSKSNVDKLNIEQDIKIKETTNKEKLQYKTSAVEKAIGEEVDKDSSDLGDNPPEASRDEVLPSVTNKEILLPSAESTADLQRDLQAGQVELSGNKLLEEKKVESHTEEEKESSEGRNRRKSITKKDEKQYEKEKLQKWTKLSREPIKEWHHKNAQSKSIYRRQYDSLNEHLPTTVFINDYSKQLFYCIKKNNLVCLRGIISKLEKIGLTVQEILKFRNKLGDTPLIYAVKRGEIDIIRFLLLQGANPKVVNNNFQSSIDIAIERGRVDMINAIAEMTPYLLEHKRIDNKEGQEMYDWAAKTKEDNELQCNKQDD